VAELREHYRDAVRSRCKTKIPALPVIRPADREKVRSILRGLRERMRP